MNGNADQAVMDIRQVLNKTAGHVHSVEAEHGIVTVQLDPVDAAVLAQLAQRGLLR